MSCSASHSINITIYINTYPYIPIRIYARRFTMYIHTYPYMNIPIHTCQCIPIHIYSKLWAISAFLKLCSTSASGTRDLASPRLVVGPGPLSPPQPASAQPAPSQPASNQPPQPGSPASPSQQPSNPAQPTSQPSPASSWRRQPAASPGNQQGS